MTSRLATGWERFWTRSGSPFHLALFRVAFAYSLFHEAGVTRAKSLYAVEGGFHLPYLSFIQPVSQQTFDWMYTLQLPLVVLLGLGLLTRVSITALLAIQGYIFFSDQLNFRNHPYFFLLVLLLLALSPCDEALSLRSLLRYLRKRVSLDRALFGSSAPMTMQRLIQVQISIVYFYSAVHKTHPAFLRGEVLAADLGDAIASGASGRLLSWLFGADSMDRVREIVERPSTMIVPAVLTVLIEYGLSLALWFRRTRPVALIVGIGFHVGIAFLMNIGTFSYAMLGSYLLFLEPDTLRARLRPNRPG